MAGGWLLLLRPEISRLEVSVSVGEAAVQRPVVPTRARRREGPRTYVHAPPGPPRRSRQPVGQCPHPFTGHRSQVSRAAMGTAFINMGGLENTTSQVFPAASSYASSGLLWAQLHSRRGRAQRLLTPGQPHATRPPAVSSQQPISQASGGSTVLAPAMAQPLGARA